MKLAFTIHNAGRAYQEIFDGSRFKELGVEGLHWDGISWQGGIDLMRAGLFHSQICNTVSEDYAKYLQEYGEDLGDLFKQKNVFGIVNGLDLDYWKIKRSKEEAKRDLLQHVKKEVGKTLDQRLFTVTLPRRITFQKGFDLVIEIMRDIVKDRSKGGVGAQFILLGRAHELDELGKEWERELNKLSSELGSRFAFINEFDQSMAKLMYEGGDLLLYPSKSNKEPCGTGYMLAMSNMTPTLGTETGGMVEVLEEFNPKTGKGNGWRVSKKDYSATAFLSKMKMISDIFYDKPELWKKIMANCSNDIKKFDMKNIAKLYVLKMYKPLLS